MEVLKIGAKWCSGCLVMRARWAKIEKELPWLITETYDYDEDKSIVEKYGLEEGTLPTFIFLDKKGNEIQREHGEMAKEKLLEIIEKNKDK